MDPLIEAELNLEQPSEFHKTLLEHCKSLVSLSRTEMGKKYNDWDANLDFYEVSRTRDDADRDAANRKEPEKFVVPISYSQVQTFVAFNISLFTQRESLFELVGRGEEDERSAAVGEAMLNRDLEWNNFYSVLYQFLTDVARFGVGIIKSSWIVEKEKRTVPLPEQVVKVLGTNIGSAGMQAEVEVVKYEGNKLNNISPYNFFPDPRISLCNFQQGEFCASEQEWTMTSLREMEANGEITGVEYIKPLTRDVLTGRRKTALGAGITSALAVAMTGQTTGSVVVTEVQAKLVPADFKINDKPMGESTRPEIWNIWYANDDRIIRAEPLGYKHNQFTFDVGQYAPDNHRLSSMSLCDTINKLQDVTDWLYNSHILNVRKVIGDKLIVDPAGVEMADLKERRPVIRLQSGVARQGVDKFIKQLQVSDVTINHMRDAADLHNMVQITTGINDNALGQYNIGRRSATEARNVNSSAAARLKVIAFLLFKNALQPMARKMLSNLQDGLTSETYVRVVGEMADPNAYNQFVKVTRDDLVGEFDFEIFDGTLPSERAVQAGAIEEFLVAIMKTPQVVIMLGYDPRKLVEEWLTLRGIRHPKRFLLDQVRQQELQMQMQGMYGRPEQSGLSANGLQAPGGEAGGFAALVGAPQMSALPVATRDPEQ